MGTWGLGAFDNDGAADWAMELEEASSPAPVKRAIARVARTKPGKEVDVDDALEAIAAAAIVAAARGHASSNMPDEVSAWIAAHDFAPSDDLRAAAITAVKRIAAKSELKAEWDGDKAWQREQDKLIQRLRKPAKAVRRPRPTVIVAEAPAEPPPDPQCTALERALKKLKLRVYVNSAGEPREIVALDTPTIADADMRLLAPLRTLEGFQLSNSRITDAAAEHLGGLPKLKWAWLTETRIGDRVAAVLASSSPRLHDLELEETRITDRGLRHLARSGKLQSLNLRGTVVTDAGVAHLARLPQLRAPSGRNQGHGRRVQKFGENSRLERLDLSDTRVTDAIVPHLARLKRLRALFLAGTRITRAGVRRLSAALPKTDIDMK